MANTYKNIVITTNIGSATDDPKIVFSGANTSTNTDITLRVYPTSNGTVSFEGSAGQLFSVTNQLTGTLFSVNDVSGIPSIEVLDTGLVKLAQYNGNVGIGTANASYKLDVNGTARISGNLVFSNTTSNGITFADGTRQTSAFVGGAIDQVARDTANLSINTNASQNVRIDYSNTALAIAQGIDNSQNVRIDYSNTVITIIQGVDNSQNVRLDWSNTSIAATDGKMSSAYNVANTADVRSTASYFHANGAFIKANAAFDAANASFAGVNTAIAIIQGVNATQNTNISNKVNLTGSLNQTISGNVTIGQDLVISGNLVITGNINSQNVQQLTVADPLIVLGIGNYVSDTKDIGFAGHYNDGTNAHAGIIRDSTTKEFYVFKGYTPEVDANNNVDINDATFSKANLNAGIFKGNLIATTSVVNGIDLNTYSSAAYAQANVTIGVDATQNTSISATDGKMQNAYGVANTADVRSTAAYFHANGAFIKANAAFDAANATNGKMESAYFQANGAFIKANAAFGAANAVVSSISATNGKMESAYFQANGAFIKANAAFDYANTIINSGNSIDNVARANANAAYFHANGAFIRANAAFDAANSAVNATNATNIRVTVIEGTNASQNVRLDYSNTAITVIQGTNLSQNVRLDWSNTSIAATDGKMQNAYTQANTAITNVAATDGKMQSSYNQANTDYTTLSATPGTYGSSSLVPVFTLAANGRVTSVTNTTVTTPVPSGYLPNSVIFANTAGYLSNTSSLQFFTSNNTLYVANGISVGTFESEPSSVYVGGRVGFANNNISIVYQVYNANTNSLDTIFG